ncbi:acetyltransferase [Nocardioides sp.]|uniref:acetyltransferase n=1 Tax=Nocardioides sp. TaxID=35761 RepID=UPI0035663BDA
MADAITVFAVASPYAWDVVETARRLHRTARCVDNFGGADPRLPGLDEQVDPDLPFVLGLASAVHRAAGAHAAHAKGFDRPRKLVDPSAVLASTVEVGHGVYVNAGVVVGSHVTLGCHVNLNRSASVGHDNTIEFAASLGPGALTAGGVHIGAAAFIGAGSTVLPGVRIGRRATVGAGAVVTRDVEDFEVVIGNPARPMPPRKHIEPVEEDRCPHCSRR